MNTFSLLSLIRYLEKDCVTSIAPWLLEKNYYITPATGSSDQLERRCWNENHVPAEAGLPGPHLSSPGERERKAVITRRVGSSICCSLCSVSNFLSHTTLSIKWEVYFSKELCPLVFIVSACICIWVCNIMAYQPL